jgi:hypothetical protein
MKLFTFYGTVPEHNAGNELKLLCLWREHWSQRGCDPFVLNEWQASKHVFYGEFLDRISKLPTVNSPHYERFCFVRWLALAQVGGGMMTDFDVFSRDLSGMWQGAPANVNKLHIGQMRNVCPSLVYATAEVALRLCKEFATGKYGRREHDGKIHQSDMLAIEDLVTVGADWIELHDVVRDFQGSEGWENAPLLHFSNGSMSPKGFTPRWKFIPELLSSNVGAETRPT